MNFTKASALKTFQQILSESFLNHHGLNKLCQLTWEEKANQTFCFSSLFSIFNLLVTKAHGYTVLSVSFK